eukprot:jgi/Ulvmu1/12318/UM089_0002.1
MLSTSSVTIASPRLKHLLLLLQLHSGAWHPVDIRGARRYTCLAMSGRMDPTEDQGKNASRGRGRRKDVDGVAAGAIPPQWDRYRSASAYVYAKELDHIRAEMATMYLAASKHESGIATMVEQLENLLNPSKQLLPQPALRPGYTAASWNMHVKMREAGKRLKLPSAIPPLPADPRLYQESKRAAAEPQAGTSGAVDPTAAGAAEAQDPSKGAVTEGLGPDSRPGSASGYVDLSTSGPDTSADLDDSQYVDLVSGDNSEHEHEPAGEDEGDAPEDAAATDVMDAAPEEGPALAEPAPGDARAGHSGAEAMTGTEGGGGDEVGKGAGDRAGSSRGAAARDAAEWEEGEGVGRGVQGGVGTALGGVAAGAGGGPRPRGGRPRQVPRGAGGRWALQPDAELRWGKEPSALQFQPLGVPGRAGGPGEEAGLPGTVELMDVEEMMNMRDVAATVEGGRGAWGPGAQAEQAAGGGGAGEQQRERRYPLLPSLLPSSCLQRPPMAPALQAAPAAEGAAGGDSRGRQPGRSRGRGRGRGAAQREGVGGAQLWAPALAGLEQLYGRQRQLVQSRIPPAVHVVRTAEEILRRRDDVRPPWWAVHVPGVTGVDVDLAEAEMLFSHADGGCVEVVSGVVHPLEQSAPAASAAAPPGEGLGVERDRVACPTAGVPSPPRCLPTNVQLLRGLLRQGQISRLTFENETLFRELLNSPARGTQHAPAAPSSAAISAPPQMPIHPHGTIVNVGGQEMAVFLPVDTIGLACRPPPQQAAAHSALSGQPLPVTVDACLRRPLDVSGLRGSEWRLPADGEEQQGVPWDYASDLVRVLRPSDRLQLPSAEAPDHESVRFKIVVLWRLETRLTVRWGDCVQHRQCLSFNDHVGSPLLFTAVPSVLPTVNGLHKCPVFVDQRPPNPAPPMVVQWAEAGGAVFRAAKPSYNPEKDPVVQEMRAEYAGMRAYLEAARALGEAWVQTLHDTYRRLRALVAETEALLRAHGIFFEAYPEDTPVMHARKKEKTTSRAQYLDISDDAQGLPDFLDLYRTGAAARVARISSTAAPLARRGPAERAVTAAAPAAEAAGRSAAGRAGHAAAP